MDALLGQVTSQAMNHAIRSGITITTAYAFRQCARLIKETPRSQAREELVQLRMRLHSKICIISPAIDMIELISARGNTTLESAVDLAKEIRYDIQWLGRRLNDATNDKRVSKGDPRGVRSKDERERQLHSISGDIKKLLAKIEDAVSLFNLAITVSGVNLSTNLSGTISPSRLLQASTFLTAADSKFAAQVGKRVQIGPTYIVSLYMLFAGHARRSEDEARVRGMTWKEVMHKARVKLMRVTLEDLYELPGGQHRTVDGGIAADCIPADGSMAEYAYRLMMIEDLDDDRVHTFEDGEKQPGPFEDVASAGIRDIVPVHEISKIFYADTGKILNIGGDDDGNKPVLLLKRETDAEPPRRMMHRSQVGENGYDGSVLDEGVGEEREDQSEVDAQLHRESALPTPTRSATGRGKVDGPRLPADLDSEWMAFEVYVEEPDSEEDAEDTPPETVRPQSSGPESPVTRLTSALSRLNYRGSTPPSSPAQARHDLPSPPPAHTSRPRAAPQVKTSLSLLEMLLKLTSLQQFRQESHLSIEDELLNFFLEDSASAGAGTDKDYRQRLRNDAMKRVGFDPYDESPIKRRGEHYLENARGAASPRPSFDVNAFAVARGYEQYGYGREGTLSPSQGAYSSIESPSPIPLAMQTGNGSNGSREGTPAKSGRGPRLSNAALLATPPSSAPNSEVFVRRDSEQKARSPLHLSEVVNEKHENGRET